MLTRHLWIYDKERANRRGAWRNCFSLQKDTKRPSSFERAIQVDNEFAYAYPTAGHEMVLTERLIIARLAQTCQQEDPVI